MVRATSKRPKPTNRTPLPSNPTEWQQADERVLAARLQEEALKNNINIEAITYDALHQAQKIGTWGVSEKYLNKILAASKYDLDGRPHADYGQAPVGRPKKHLELAQLLEKFGIETDKLRYDATRGWEAFQKGEMDSSVVVNWCKYIGRAMKDLTKIMTTLDAENDKLSSNGTNACYCKLCRQIAGDLQASRKNLDKTQWIFEILPIELDKAQRAVKQQRKAPQPQPQSRSTPARPARPQRRKQADSAAGFRLKQLNKELSEMKELLTFCRTRIGEVNPPQTALDILDLAVEVARREQLLMAEIEAVRNDVGMDARTAGHQV